MVVEEPREEIQRTDEGNGNNAKIDSNGEPYDYCVEYEERTED